MVRCSIIILEGVIVPQHIQGSSSNNNFNLGVQGYSIQAGGVQPHGNQNPISSFFTPVTAISDPVGYDVPQNIKDKIANSQFVDFAVLLDKGGVFQHEVKSDQMVTMNEKGHLMLCDQKPTKELSIDEWTSSFIVFLAIFLQSHPGRAQEMLKYCQLVRTAASRYGKGWLDYDREFRFRQMAHPERYWGMIDYELWNLYVPVTTVLNTADLNPPHNYVRPQAMYRPRAPASPYYYQNNRMPFRAQNPGRSSFRPRHATPASQQRIRGAIFI